MQYVTFFKGLSATYITVTVLQVCKSVLTLAFSEE